MTAWLRDAVHRSFAPPWHAATERAVFGTLDADGIVDAIGAACRRSFGVPLVDAFLYEVSAGIVIGCHLDDGRDVVLKAYQQRWPPEFLAAVKRVQGALPAAGFPCPEPLAAELRIGAARVLAESVLLDPGTSPATPETRRVLAAGLAELVARARVHHEPALAMHPLRRPFAGAFPEPHSPIFDFESTRAGAEWLEDLALRARSIVDADASPPTIAHTDWSRRNVRAGATRLRAVYDWDSLALVRESEAVAIAATTWCKSGAADDPTPSVDDLEAYVAEYEAARGATLTPAQRRAVRAAAVATMAYTARCEHAIDPDEQQWTTTRPRLRAAAAVLLGGD
jgi:hypothetical protein